MKTIILSALLMATGLSVAYADDFGDLAVAPSEAQPTAPVATLAFAEPPPTVSCDMQEKPSHNWTLTVRNRKFAGQVEKHHGNFNMMNALRDSFCPDDI